MYETIKSVSSYACKFIWRSYIPLLLNSRPVDAQYRAVGNQFSRLFVRQESGREMYNVFDDSGKKLWIIESASPYSSTFIVYSAEEHIPLANIKLGPLNRSTTFYRHQLIETNKFYRDYKCGGFFKCEFGLKDGTRFLWTRQSKCLEQVITRSDGKQVRIRVAEANLLRKWHFDWELKINHSFDPLIATVTAFIPMKSQWSMAQYSPSTGLAQAIGTKDDLNCIIETADLSLNSPDLNDVRYVNNNVGSNARKRGKRSLSGLKQSKYIVYTEPSPDLNFFNPSSM